MNKILNILGSLAIPYILLFVSLQSVMYNEEFYDQQFAQNGAYEKFGRETVQQAASDLLKVYRSGGPLTNALFNKKEMQHADDVRKLYQGVKGIFYGCLILFLSMMIFMRKKEERANMLIRGSCITLLVLILLVPVLLTEFTPTFTRFHEMVFTNADWMLNPATDNMILLFPESFFVAFATSVLKTTSMLTLICLGIGKAMHSRNVC